MSYLNSCNICYRPFHDNYTIWNATSIKYNKIFNNIYQNSYNTCNTFFIYYNSPPRIMCLLCHEYYNSWSNLKSKDKIKYIQQRYLGISSIKKKVIPKCKIIKKCILCCQQLTKTFYKTCYNIENLGPLCYHCYK